MGSCFSSGDSSPSTQPSVAAVSHTSAAIQSANVDSIQFNSHLNKVQDVTSRKQFDKIVTDPQNANVLILCDFYADWCAPCLHIAPVIHKWALNDYKNSVIFIQIDVDKWNDLSNDFLIDVLPTLVLFKNGKEIHRMMGSNVTDLKREIDKRK